jgi:succinylglutamate desuccinylase
MFWDIAPCSRYMNRRFGGTYHLHLQGRKSAEKETSEGRWLGRITPKHRFIYRLHGAISQKMANFRNYRFKNLKSYLLDPIFNTRCETKSSYRKTGSTHRVFSSGRLYTQGMTQPQRCSRQTIGAKVAHSV